MDKHHSSFFASDAGWFRGVHEDALVTKRVHWLQALIAWRPPRANFRDLCPIEGLNTHRLQAHISIVLLLKPIRTAEQDKLFSVTLGVEDGALPCRR
jgi:hypothetical protein